MILFDLDPWCVCVCVVRCCRVLSIHDIRGMPVVDESGKVLGLISGKEVREERFGIVVCDGVFMYSVCGHGGVGIAGVLM